MAAQLPSESPVDVSHNVDKAFTVHTHILVDAITMCLSSVLTCMYLRQSMDISFSNGNE